MEWSPEKSFGEGDARRQIDIYGSELAAMAVTAMQQYPNFDPPGAVVCEPGTSEGRSLLEQRCREFPIREVENGVCLAVLPREPFLELSLHLAPGYADLVGDERLTGPGRLPILAVCKEGSMMGAVMLPA